MKSHRKYSFRMSTVGRWMRAVAPLVIVFASLAAPTEQADAYPVTFEFAGEVTDLFDRNNLFGGAVSIGDAFSGTYTFESTTPDTLADPSLGLYTDAITHISGQINGIDYFGPIDDFPNGPANSISVIDDRDEVADGYSLRAGVEFLGHPLQYQLIFGFRSASVLGDDSLLLEPPPFEVITTSDFRLISEGTGIGLNLQGEIQSIVPEPTSLALLTIGAVALLRRRSRP